MIDRQLKDDRCRAFRRYQSKWLSLASEKENLRTYLKYVLYLKSSMYLLVSKMTKIELALQVYHLDLYS